MRKLMIAIAITMLSSAAIAEDIDYKALDKDGFSDVSDLLKEMTPEQRAAVLQQAKKKQAELKKLSPQEQAHLRDQLRSTADTIDMKNVDPQKLHIEDSKNAHDTRQDLTTYQDRYKQGKIHNSVVKAN